jgi:hypothetical protein
MTGAESTGRNPVTFPKRAHGGALGVVADRCRHLRQGSSYRAEALACQTRMFDPAGIGFAPREHRQFPIRPDFSKHRRKHSGIREYLESTGSLVISIA